MRKPRLREALWRLDRCPTQVSGQVLRPSNGQVGRTDPSYVVEGVCLSDQQPGPETELAASVAADLEAEAPGSDKRRAHEEPAS